jgi:hypothetical protein
VTRAFDNLARLQPDIYEGLTNEIDIQRLKVERTQVKIIRRAIVTGHYSGVMPDACQDVFACWNHLGGLVGAVAYGPGGNNKTLSAIIEGMNNQKGRELIRLWVHPNAPKNTASKMVAQSLKLLPNEVELVVTFADSGQKHLGIVYQALNFYYLGMSNEGIRYVDKSGIEVTARLANIYRIRQPERFGQMTNKEIRQELGWQAVKSHSKHRYAIGVGRNKNKINMVLNGKKLPYPKDLIGNV